jgi:hypothetical protein
VNVGEPAIDGVGRAHAIAGQGHVGSGIAGCSRQQEGSAHVGKKSDTDFGHRHRGAPGDLIVREVRSLRRITVNRPKALNALTLDMAVKMTALLRSWATDPAVGAVLLDGAGERGLCAGGDIRALCDAAKSGDSLPEKFGATEYYLNVLIARYPKPFIAVMDGMVMDGGVGLSTPCRAPHRLVNEAFPTTRDAP